MIAASGVRQKLCTNPVAKSSAIPTAKRRGLAEQQDGGEPQARRSRAWRAAARSRKRLAPTSSEPASAPDQNAAASQPRPDCPTAIDVLRDIGQQAEDERVGEQVDEEGDAEGAQQVGLVPDVAEALLEVRRGVPRPACAEQRFATPNESRNAATYMPVTTAYAGPMPISATPAVPVNAPATRAVSEVVRERPSAPQQHVGPHGLPDQHVAHHHVRRPKQAGERRDGEDMPRLQRVAQRERRQHRGEQRVDTARDAKQGAMPDAVSDDAEERRKQRSEPDQGGDDDELLHRAGGGQDVPAEDQRLHLESPRGGEVGGPLEAKAADRKGRCHTRMLQGNNR